MRVYMIVNEKGACRLENKAKKGKKAENSDPE
jgi:hypothetical protein